MILRDAINDYIAWRQAHGAKFHSSASVLHCFCKHVGGNIGCDAVVEADVLGFLPVTDPSPGTGPTSTAPWPASTATRSAAATRAGRRFRRAMMNRGDRGRQRLTSTPVTSCSACSAPSMSAGGVRSGSMPTPCGRCSCFYMARGCVWARHSASRSTMST